jgi:uncharacterized protein YbaP (TraB family)
MKHFIAVTLLTFSFLMVKGQLDIKEKKYPSLLWEISGNGLKKPSYLIGTMHVSNKLAFNLPDSFYIAVKNAQVVALETNPETWQDDMDKYETSNSGFAGGYGISTGYPSDYFTINTLKFYKYYTKIERALFSNPSAINSLLYRTYGNQSADFEEDTYLDMYIFQCGKKWGKKVAGVEDYGESMRLMAEAYQDAAKEKNKKRRGYSGDAEAYSMDKLQEAYRTGNLDLLDTINKFNSTSDAFDEKFLYRRNEIQARSIDSIIKSGNTLFVGVGAAHLPGQRGVIEILRKKGYKLRPVKMGERNSKQKDIVDKLRVPVVFKTAVADDGLYKVDIPGKFFKAGEDASLDQRQYADMANGSYYMVTRISTNAWMWNHTEDKVLAAVDSLLYENTPGKIISKTPIVKNGYKGFDITNRTRRGDLQRYNIFVTPFEVLFFKMSGNADYVKAGEEAGKFFGSIQLKEFKAEANGWKKYSPPLGGFAADLPHTPYISNDGSWLYDALDKTTGTQYRIIKSDIHNYNFIEEDTFDLSLLDESFMSSEFIDTELYRRQTTFKGYPALDAKYRDKDGGIYLTKFIIQGPHYYTVVAHGKNEIPAMDNFINSFEIKPYLYGKAKLQTDTSLHFTVTTPVYPESKKIKLDMPEYNPYGSGDDDDNDPDIFGGAEYKTKLISNDTTGEKIAVSFYKWPKYFYTKDSSLLEGDKSVNLDGDTSWIIRMRKKVIMPDGVKVRETIISDTGSSRTLWAKVFLKEGAFYMLTTQYDTLSAPSEFVKTFYETFKPADTIKGVDPYTKKSKLFFDDFVSTDTVARKKALKQIATIDLDSSDYNLLVSAVNSLGWKEKNYLKTKGALLAKFGDIKTKESARYLRDMYYAAGDTIQFQYVILENLLQQKTAYAYSLFRDIVNNEPPVIDERLNSRAVADYGYRIRLPGSSIDNNNFLDELSDSLQLSKTILPDLLPLLNLQDYKTEMMGLLGQMVDSNLVSPSSYEMYFSKFLIEAKQELRKQAIAEKKKLIDDAEESKKEKKEKPYYSNNDKDAGNADLSLYATLLLPFADKNPAVMPLIEQMLKSNDKRLKYNTLFLLMDKGKIYPDTLLKYFAGLDEYRYELYADLKERKKLGKFPSLYKNHSDLAYSKLLTSKSYEKPDSIIFADRLAMNYKDKKGFIYFFKYKDDKEDMTWKLATVGLVPENPAEIEFDDTTDHALLIYYPAEPGRKGYNRYDFTEFTETAIKEDKPLPDQLKKELKKMLYSRRKSAAQFYDDKEVGGSERRYYD